MTYDTLGNVTIDLLVPWVNIHLTMSRESQKFSNMRLLAGKHLNAKFKQYFHKLDISVTALKSASIDLSNIATCLLQIIPLKGYN